MKEWKIFQKNVYKQARDFPNVMGVGLKLDNKAKAISAKLLVKMFKNKLE